MLSVNVNPPSEVLKRAAATHKVKEMMIRQLNLEMKPQEIDNDSPLFGMGLGLDSVDALEVIVGLEQEFGMPIEEGNKGIFRSVNSIVDFVVDHGRSA